MSVLDTNIFHQSVHSLKPKIAVFDCDGTLWSGDAGSTFMHWTIENGLVSPAAAEWLNGRYEGYKEGTVDELAICGEMVQVFAGISDAAMREAAKAFFAEVIERNIFPEMKTLVDDLQANGVEIWAVSSTCDWVVEEGVQRFGIPPERVLAACVRVVDGLATKEIVDVPTDEGKVASLKRMGITTPDAVFGNSVHDAAMLTIARRAFPVNPTPALVERSLQEGWKIFYPASVRPVLLSS